MVILGAFSSSMMSFRQFCLSSIIELFRYIVCSLKSTSSVTKDAIVRKTLMREKRIIMLHSSNTKAKTIWRNPRVNANLSMSKLKGWLLTYFIMLMPEANSGKMLTWRAIVVKNLARNN